MSNRVYVFAILSVAGLVAFCAAFAASSPGPEAASLTDDGSKITVKLSGELFTEYHYKGFAKPILYPIIGPTGAGMTRNWPIKEGVKGEANDHPHHKSFWYTHGSVNGVDFWMEGDKAGKVVHDKLLKAEAAGGRAVIQTADKWVGPDGKCVCTDERTMTFSTGPAGRFIDFEITLIAGDGDVTFGDTKEGTMAIRTCPPLRLTNDKKRGVTEANGKAVNSEGVEGKDVWGKRAKWVDYWGLLEGKTVGVAIFDHPGNPRHPTWWHARDYGLIAANPFGINDFEKKGKGAGDLKIPAGQKVTFRYRFYFHTGDVAQAEIAKRYEEYAGAAGK